MKLTTHLHVAASLIMSGAPQLLMHMPSRKKREIFLYLFLPLSLLNISTVFFIR